MTGRPPANTALGIRWEMDLEQAADLADVLGLLEDFLRHASCQAVDELARFPLARPLDPVIWASWLADYLGDQVLALRAASRNATACDPSSTGDLT